MEKPPDDKTLALALERYGTLLAVTGDWVWEASPEGILTYNSSSVCTITGYTAGELLGKNLSGIFSPHGGQNSLTHLIDKVCLTGEFLQGIEMSVSHKDGRELILEISVLPVRDHNAQIIGVRGVCQNVTTQRRAQEALRESEERYRTFIESAPIGMMISDTNGHIAYSNQKLMEITGYDVADWKGRSYIEMVYPDDYGTILENRTRAIRTLEPVDPYEIRIFNAEGKLIWLRLIPHSVYKTDENGNRIVAYFQNFVEDVTASKQTRSEKHRQEQQLTQAHKMEALGTLAGGVAHDFNNFLYPIIGYTEMTLSEVGDIPFAAENLREVLAAAKRARKLVEQILAFSRYNEEKPRPMRIQSVLEDVLSLMRPSIPSNVVINKNIQEAGGVVIADQTQIHQVVMNLCTNAYQSMGGQGGVLGITLDQCLVTQPDLIKYPQLSPGNYVRLSISDSGMGMDHATKQRIFEPYFTTKPADKGTGMGLAVVHGIVSKYNGVINVESEPAKGSTFTVFLPQATKTLGDLPEQQGVPLPKGTEKILLVGGEKPVQDISAKMLTRLGYSISTADSGEAALNILENNSRSFDMILVDAVMEGMPGEVLAEKIKAVWPGLPALFIAELPDQDPNDNQTGGLTSGLTVRPLGINRIAQGIREVLDNSPK